jgi:hypothetical protein
VYVFYPNFCPLLQILPIQSGEGKNGVWKKQDIILEIDGGKKLCIGLWNDKIISDLMEGSMLKVSFEIDSREYNEKWFTNLRGWKVEDTTSGEVNDTGNSQEDEIEDFGNGGDVLPF